MILYVVQITLPHFDEGKEEEILYQRFFKSLDSAKSMLPELKKRVTEKGYDYSFGNTEYDFCGDGSIYYVFDNENLDNIEIRIEDDLSTFYESIDGKYVLSDYFGGGRWDSKERALNDIFHNPKYTFDNF